ncbi:MAG: hypothetical protein AB4911_16355 [Oscillochloridaceae bacterium umkhey_bin13]
MNAGEPRPRRLIISLPPGDPTSDAIAQWVASLPERQRSAVVRQALHRAVQATDRQHQLLDPATQQHLAATLTEHLVATLPPLLGAAILTHLGATLSGAAHAITAPHNQEDGAAPADATPPTPGAAADLRPPSAAPPPRPAVQIATADLDLLDELVGEG